MERVAHKWQVPVTRALLFAGIWLVIAGPTAGAWLIGAPAVAAATWASLLLEPRSGFRLSALGFLRFSVFFLRESLLGGLDVARRTLGTRLRIQPEFVHFRSRLPAGRPRVLFLNCVNLLPGTLAADLQADRLLIHVLDIRTDVLSDLERLEKAVAALFGTELEARHV